MRISGLLFFAFLSCLYGYSQEMPEKKDSRFELMKLPYATDALEPAISKATVELHHGKHLQGYVNNLNAALPGSGFENMPLEEIVVKAEGGIFNNAGQVLNHNLYFSQFSPNGGGKPSGSLSEAINATWGTFESFRKEFVKAGASLFGSGWLWLAKDKNGKLSILLEPNGSNPAVKGLVPVLGIDLWEHAYYLDYQNRRADHLEALWGIIDWKVVEERY